MPTAKPLPGATDGPVSRGREAVLLLRARPGAVPVGVTWPDTTAGAVPVVLLLAPDEVASTTRRECATGLANGARVVVVDLRCGAAPPEPAGPGRDAELAAAGYTLRWLADHAAELGGDPARIVVASVAGAVETASAVTERARADGWPLVAGQIQIRRLDRPDEIRRRPRSAMEHRVVTVLLATLARRQ